MEQLVRRAKKGDADAFANLIQSRMQQMYKTARAILKNDEDAADAISDTILACWEKIGQLKEDAYFSTWLTRILIHKCEDILRRQKKVFPAEELPEVPVRDVELENLEWKEMLSLLDEKYRLPIVLYYGNGFSTREISRILDIPEGTVRVRLSRARDKAAELYGIADRKERQA